MPLTSYVALGTIVFLRCVGPEADFITVVLLKKMNKNISVENVTKTHDPVKKWLGLLSASWEDTVLDQSLQ